jgi:hypothetical protein
VICTRGAGGAGAARRGRIGRSERHREQNSCEGCFLEEGRQYVCLVKVEARLCRCNRMAVIHATLGSRVQVDTIASQCIPLSLRGVAQPPRYSLPSSSSLGGGLSMVLKFEVPYRCCRAGLSGGGRIVGGKTEERRFAGDRGDTLVDALITSPVRRIRARGPIYFAQATWVVKPVRLRVRRKRDLLGTKDYETLQYLEVKVQQGGERKKCDVGSERKGGSACCCKSGKGREGAGYGNGTLYRM